MENLTLDLTQGPPAERSVSGPQGPAPTPAKQPLKRLTLFILLDVTGSMAPYIEGARNTLYRVIEILEQGRFDPLVGLILFRDEQYGEMPEVHPLGTPPDEIRSILKRTAPDGGGDDPESSLPAIARALDALGGLDSQTPRVFLHITDAGLHDPEAGHTAASILAGLVKKGVVFFACAPAEEPYTKFCNATGGTLFPIRPDMDAGMFESVLADVARTVVKTLPQVMGVISPDTLAALKAIREQR